MDFLIELLFELVFEGSLELSQSSKAPKLVRYVFIIIIVLFYLTVLGIVFYAGLLMIERFLPLGIFITFIGIYMLIRSIIGFNRVYLKKEAKYENRG